MGKAKVTKTGAARPKKEARKGKVGKKNAGARKKAARVALSVEEKQQMLKPLTGFWELIDRLASTWKDHGGKVKVPGLSPSRLASLLRRAVRASSREEAVRTAYEAKIQPLADARLKAEHEMWKSALDLHAMVKTAARTDLAIAMPFEFFAEALARRRAGAGAAAAAAAAAVVAATEDGKEG